MLHVPLLINSTQIGEVEIVRRCDEGGCDRSKDSGRTFTYDWTVYRFQMGTTKITPKVCSGELTHAYADGAFELLRKVLAAYAESHENA